MKSPFSYHLEAAKKPVIETLHSIILNPLFLHYKSFESFSCLSCFYLESSDLCGKRKKKEGCVVIYFCLIGSNTCSRFSILSRFKVLWVGIPCSSQPRLL